MMECELRSIIDQVWDNKKVEEDLLADAWDSVDHIGSTLLLPNHWTLLNYNWTLLIHIFTIF